VTTAVIHSPKCSGVLAARITASGEIESTSEGFSTVHGEDNSFDEKNNAERGSDIAHGVLHSVDMKSYFPSRVKLGKVRSFAHAPRRANLCGGTECAIILTSVAL